MCCFARALSLDPEIILLDDICAGIDAHNINKLLGILTEEKLSHCARMLTTSRLSTVARAFTSYAVLNDGNFFYIRNSDDLLECDTIHGYGQNCRIWHSLGDLDAKTDFIT